MINTDAVSVGLQQSSQTDIPHSINIAHSADSVWTGENRMTIKEAIEQFKERLAITDYRKQIPEYYEAIEMAVDALEKADKYKWHDLRKNPDDLPEADGNSESKYVLVMIGTPEWNSWEQAYYHHGKRLWSTYDQNVFAWRYIEPFKEEEECVSD